MSISSAPNSGGTIYTRLWNDAAAGAGNVSIGVSFRFTAVSDHLYFWDSRGASGDYILGYSLDTFMQLTRSPEQSSKKVKDVLLDENPSLFN